MPAGPLDLGRAGEAAAESLLRAKGYEVLERNWRFRQLELDLICRDRDRLVFVEVKSRGRAALGSGAEAVTRAKQAKLSKAAARYLSENGLWGRACRFDLVLVRESEAGLVAEHLIDAFEVRLDGEQGWQPW
ncbi:MAG: YraN family protein [Desulfovibrionaceae bacterium]|nr:YraN family protein [Desulfovibrionaceae bacterium]MDD4953045.1 YraN family protein [Desulfovibrionaceae bacterium]